MSLRRQNGFTLIELMVTLTVFVILASIAYPSFRSMIRSNRLATANNEVIALTNLARSEAIRNNRGGGLCGSTDGQACDGEWSKGLLAWSDLDADGVLGSNDSVLRFSLGNPQLSVVGPRERPSPLMAVAVARPRTIRRWCCPRRPARPANSAAH